ncbi:immunity 49 family protein [Streptomyces sp. NPDC058534]|uniref:immunity 49 family protein n=1 Tax=Streptomyces sp. NPDC058534 TaxID=3346541 RepID=UPI00364FD68A
MTEMVGISRHVAVDEYTDRQISRLSTTIDDYLAKVSRLPGLTSGIAKRALALAEHRSLRDPEAEERETYAAVLLAAQAGSGFFATANRAEGSFAYTVGSVRTVEGTGPTRSHGPANWLDALWTSVICRGRHLVHELCRTPGQTLRGGGGGFDAYMHAWIDALRTFFEGGDDLYSKINRSIELTAPDALRGTPAEIVLLRYYPSMKLLFSLAAGNGGQFNEDLREAVELHRRFWTADSERAGMPEGFIALAPTALAAIAHDKGFVLEVESEYLPKNLIQGTWVN